MNKLKKKMVLFFVLILICCMAACTKDTAKNTAGSEITELVHANFRDTRDLNPHLYGGEFFAQNLLFEGLVVITDSGIKPSLAESWDISDDGLVYTFYLRKGVSFTDGYKWDAKAAELNFQALFNNKDRHGWLESIRATESFEAVDEYIFEIKLSKPYYPLLTDLGVTRPYRFISPNCFIDGNTKDGVTSYVGTGKYKITEHKVDEQTVFERNDNYWGEKAKIQKPSTTPFC